MTPDSTPQIRLLTPDDLPEWMRACNRGFLREPVVGEEESAVRSEVVDLARTHGAFDGDRCVGTFRTMPQQLTVPGGAALPSCAVTNVTVTPTHRRRGLLTRMMAGAMDDAVARGDACATLIAAEYPIYGRHGFGPATWATAWEVDVHRAGLDPRRSGPEEGRVDFADAEEVRRVGPELHDRFRARAHGAIDRSERWWGRNTGLHRWPGDGWTEPFHVVYRDASGTPQGLLTYRAADHWEAKQPRGTATVDKLTAVTPEAERALWHFVLSVDWVSTVRTGLCAPDDLLPLLLPDPRAARVTTHADFLWVRPLDVPRMLAARTYATAGGLALEVRDEAGHAEGRFLLEAGPDGTARCARTDADPELSMDASELGTLYLGDEAAVRLAALGRVTEHRPGAAARADLLFRTSRRPWCPDVF